MNTGMVALIEQEQHFKAAGIDFCFCSEYYKSRGKRGLHSFQGQAKTSFLKPDRSLPPSAPAGMQGEGVQNGTS